jgi:large subunit ribosomal protein L1
VGRLSFTEEALLENAQAFTEAILRARPAAAKGQFVRKATLSSTMGPGIRIDPSALAA